VEQLDIIRPRVIVAMGNSAIAYFWSKFGLKTASMGELHGKDFEVNMLWGRVVLFACYHPAAALYNVELERVLEKDFQALADILRRVG
jgi:uracil-DNA glycosylase family 4